MGESMLHASLVVSWTPHVWESQLKDAGTKAQTLPTTESLSNWFPVRKLVICSPCQFPEPPGHLGLPDIVSWLPVESGVGLGDL